MQYRPATTGDFAHVETFIWHLVTSTFDRPELTDAQRAENDALVASARVECLSHIEEEHRTAIVAIDPRRRTLAGYVLATADPRETYASVDFIVVRKSEWGKGVGEELLSRALAFIGPDRPVRVAVRGYNARALAFFEKHGFENTGESTGDHEIPRILMLREVTSETSDIQHQASDSTPPTPDVSRQPLDFPTPADEPLPNFTLSGDDEDFRPPGGYTLTTEDLTEEPLPRGDDSTLTDDQLNELEAFIAKARAKKKVESKYPEIELEIEVPAAAETNVPDDRLELPDLDTDNRLATKPPNEQTSRAPNYKNTQPPTYQLTTLREEFQSRLSARLPKFFPGRAARKYWKHYEADTEFHELRDGGLSQFAKWANAFPRSLDQLTTRREATIEDLIEFFIVQRCADLHRGIFPQRLLRYQGVDPDEVNYFSMVMDYLDFDSETETVHTDFVSMPAKHLKNASVAFLHAGRDERVFLICDQSLLGNGKNGFSLTDGGLYWKTVLHPAGAITYTTLAKAEVQDDHLMLNGQFFNAGRRLNLKMLLLLYKMRRLMPKG